MQPKKPLTPLVGIPSEELKSAVLARVYDMSRITLLPGYTFLAAKYGKFDVGIFVVAGNFGRDHFKKAVEEAKSAGLKTSTFYVYGRTATYSGQSICFSKFDEIGIDEAAVCASSAKKANALVSAFKPSFPNPEVWTDELILQRQKEAAAFAKTPEGMAEDQAFDAAFDAHMEQLQQKRRLTHA